MYGIFAAEGTVSVPAALTAIFQQLMSWMGELVTTISDSPLLLIPVGIFVGGAVIGLAKRLIGA